VILGRSLGSAWRSPDRNPGPPFRSSRAETRSCPTDPGRNPSPPVAARWPKSRFPPGWSWTRRSGVLPAGPSSPKALGSDGRFTKPAAFASAEGQARHRPPRGGFVSRPAFRFRLPCRPRAAGRASAPAVAGKALLRFRKIVSATSGSCHEKAGRPSWIRLWITRITGISAGRKPPLPANRATAPRDDGALAASARPE